MPFFAMKGIIMLSKMELKRTVMRKYFNRMNENQFQAVVQVNGHVLLFAGAGSGKTTVLVNRTINLMRFGNAYFDTAAAEKLTLDDIQNLQNYLAYDTPIPPKTLMNFAVSPCAPQEIMAITFTNKAANELKARISTALGKTGSSVCAKTFHSVCATILRKFPTKLGYGRKFAIYDSDDSKAIAFNCIKEFLIEFLSGRYYTDPYWMSQDPAILNAFITDIQNKPKGYASDCLEKISLAKDRLIDCNEFQKIVANSSDLVTHLCGIIYPKYQTYLEHNNSMDFGDLLMNTYKLFSMYPDILYFYQCKYRYIMVDEYQDTNIAQLQLIRLLENGYHNLCVVGDDDQSIYKFRGAEISNILDFQNQFPQTVIIKLEQNYRSSQNILRTANTFIAHNTIRAAKTMWTQNDIGTPICYVKSTDGKLEAEFIAKTIKKKVAEEHYRFQDFAILYRINALARPLEPSLLKYHIPHYIYHGASISDSKVAKDIIAYFKFISNPEDSLQLKRILNLPKRGLGPKVSEKITELSKQLNRSAFSIIKDAETFNEIFNAATVNKLKKFEVLIEDLQKISEEETVQYLFTELLKKTTYLTYLSNSLKTDKERDAAAATISAIQNDIENYESQIIQGTPDLTEYLEWTALASEDNSTDDENHVSLMSIHSAKGLEFPFVFLVGFDKGILPLLSVNIDIFSNKTISALRAEKMEEERRLAYVAFTRAKKKLYLCSCEERTLYGKTKIYSASEFAFEIPTDNIKFIQQTLEQTPAIAGSH